MLTDLQKVNKCIKPMGTLQLGLPSPAQIPQTLLLKWLTNIPKWVEQWPLPQIKLEALKQLVQEQLQLGHIEPSTSPWNSPVFVIKNKSGKWKMLTDL